MDKRSCIIFCPFVGKQNKYYVLTLYNGSKTKMAGVTRKKNPFS